MLGLGLSGFFAARLLNINWKTFAGYKNSFSQQMILLFGLRMICNLLLQQDTVMLSAMKGDNTVAGYQAAFS